MGTIEIAKNLKVGDVFYETDLGYTITLVVKTEPVRSEDGQWTWIAEDATGADINYLITEGYAHYGPKIHL